MTAPASAPETLPASPQLQLAGPWIRYGARMADILLFAILLDRSPLWGVWLPRWLGGAASHPLITGTIAAALWALFETAALGYTGRTPGKWIFGLAVRRADGSALGWGLSLARSVMVLGGGLGFGIRPLAVACFLMTYGRLIRGRPAYWDAACGSRVQVTDGSVTRVAIAGVVTLALLWMLVESRMNAAPAGRLLIA